MRILTIRFVVPIFITFFLIACQGDKTKQVSQSAPAQDVKGEMLESIYSGLPDACSLMDAAFISQLIDIPAENVSIQTGGTSKTVPSRSCFFKWTGGELGNSGLMVQALGNPVPDEYADWPFFFIDNKKSLGERTVSEPDKPIKFVTMENLGDQACYSLELAKCYFRKDKTVYMIAINGVESHDKRMEIFKRVGNQVLSKI